MVRIIILVGSATRMIILMLRMTRLIILMPGMFILMGQDDGSWFMAQGSWLMAHGQGGPAWPLAPGGYVAMELRGYYVAMLCGHVAKKFRGVLLVRITNANKIEAAIYCLQELPASESEYLDV